MASANRIIFNSRAFDRILHGAGTVRAISDAAYRMASAAPGTHVNMLHASTRAIAFVATNKRASPEQAEAQREALESAAHGA